MSNTIRISIILWLLQTNQIYAHSLSNQIFEIHERALSGWVNLSFQKNGEYIYEEFVKDKRTSFPAILTGSVKRISFDIYSPQDLDLLRIDQELKFKKEQQKYLQELRENEIKNKKRLQALDWPRYKYAKDSFCVPEVEFSKKIDWSEHLTCIPLASDPNSADLN